MYFAVWSISYIIIFVGAWFNRTDRPHFAAGKQFLILSSQSFAFCQQRPNNQQTRKLEKTSYFSCTSTNAWSMLEAPQASARYFLLCLRYLYGCHKGEALLILQDPRRLSFASNYYCLFVKHVLISVGLLHCISNVDNTKY